MAGIVSGPGDESFFISLMASTMSVSEKLISS